MTAPTAPLADSLVAWVGLYPGAGAGAARELEAGLVALGFRVERIASAAQVELDDGSATPALLEETATTPVVIAVPGGPGAVDAVRDVEFLWPLRRARRHVAHYLGTGSGVVPLAAAGVCRHRRVAAPEAIHERLAKAGFVTPDAAPLVVDGPLITAQGPDAVGLVLGRLAVELHPDR